MSKTSYQAIVFDLDGTAVPNLPNAQSRRSAIIKKNPRITGGFFLVSSI
jgi:hypothetical protein